VLYQVRYQVSKESLTVGAAPAECSKGFALGHCAGSGFWPLGSKRR